MATLSQTWFSCAPTHNTRRGKGSSRKAGIRAGDHGDQFVERPAEAGDTLPSKPTDNEDSDRVVGRHLHVHGFLYLVEDRPGVSVEPKPTLHFLDRSDKRSTCPP